MRDKNDFDKINITQDREALKLEKANQLTRKPGVLSSLTLTCIGQECCDEGMTYDSLNRKCIENFGNYFENMNNIQNYLPITVVPYVESFTEKFTINKKQELLQKSLALSGPNDIYIPPTPRVG